MSGSVELTPDGTWLVIRFQYREDLVAAVKNLPSRRWDPRNKQWLVPAELVEQVYSLLSRHLFDFAPEVSSLLAGTLGGGKPAAKAKTKAPPAPTEAAPALAGALPFPAQATPTQATQATEAAAADAQASLRVSQLNGLVKDCLQRQFAEAFWVVGEIVDYDKSAGREHRFFQLVEKAPDQPRALAAVDVALFGRTAAKLAKKLGSGPDAFALRDGIEVRLLVKADFYVASGRFQVIVEDVDPGFTLGKLALSREQVLRELREQGLAERNRALGFPVPALRIGVLSSPDSDGWNDFLKHLQESPVGFDVTLVPIKVQGVEMKPTLLAGLQWFAARAAEFDVLCIVRGGGSRTDLAWFDDRDVAFAVARHPLKILVGIGHQRDQSVLDLIAHSEKTPTAVAALLVAAATDARADVLERGARLAAAVDALLRTETERLAATARRLVRGTERHLQRQHLMLAAAGRDIVAGARLRVQRERADLRAAALRTTAAADRALDRARGKLDHAAARQRLLDPLRVLGRGYALVRGPGGAVVPSVAKLAAAAEFVVQFRDGRAAAKVLSVQKDSP